MTAIVLSRRAREDFKRIWTYIARDDDHAADRLLLALDAKIERLRDFPGIGMPRDDIRPGARTLVHGSYLGTGERMVENVRSHDCHPRRWPSLLLRWPRDQRSH